MSEPAHTRERPLTTLERYLLRSERLGGDLMFAFEADFDGVLRADVLAQAFQAAVSHHPLMRSVIGGSDRDAVWIGGSSEDAFEHRRATRLCHPYCDAIEAIDLQRSPGLRIKLITADDDRSRLVGHFHHVCVDGQGVARFLRDALTLYAALLQGERPQLRRCCDPDGLPFAPPDGDPPIGALEGLRNLWVTIRGRNVKFPKLIETNAEGLRKTLVVEMELDDALTSRIHAHLLRQRHVLNDFAVTAGFLMLEQAKLSPAANDYFSILNPVDLRGFSGRRLAAANRVGFAFIRRRARDWTTADSLAQSVDQQMTYVRRRGVAAELIKGVALVERMPGCLPMIEKTGRFVATASLTCMSNLSLGRRHGLIRQAGHWQLGDATVRRVSAAAPLPPGVPLAITVIESGQKILVTMRGCSEHFNVPLLHSLIEGWRSGCEMICQRTRK